MPFRGACALFPAAGGRVLIISTSESSVSAAELVARLSAGLYVALFLVSAGLDIISQAYLARQRRSSAASDRGSHGESMFQSAMRWVSVNTQTPQLAVSGCSGVLYSFCLNVVASIPVCASCSLAT